MQKIFAIGVVLSTLAVAYSASIGAAQLKTNADKLQAPAAKLMAQGVKSNQVKLNAAAKLQGGNYGYNSYDSYCDPYDPYCDSYSYESYCDPYDPYCDSYSYDSYSYGSYCDPYYDSYCDSYEYYKK